jgi:hypothetical protein
MTVRAYYHTLFNFEKYPFTTPSELFYIADREILCLCIPMMEV